MPLGMLNEREKKTGFSRRFIGIPARRANPAHVEAGARTFFVTSSAWEKQNLRCQLLRDEPRFADKVLPQASERAAAEAKLI
jgi:hypothetical protein